MKRPVLCFLLILYATSMASGISSDIRNNYEPGETIIGKLSGEILEQISSSQVKLKRNNVNIAFEYDIKKLGENYYIWLISPQVKANYTLVIEGIITRVNGVVQSEDYTKTFSVSGNLTDYSITPGFIFTSADFVVNALLNEDFSKSINVDFPEAREIVLHPGSNGIRFSIAHISETRVYTIAIGKYNFPAYILGQNLSSNGQNNSQNVSVNQSVVEQNNSINMSNGQNQSVVNQSGVNNSVNALLPKFELGTSVIKAEIPKTNELPNFKFEVINKGESMLSPRFNYNRGRFAVSPESITIAPGESFEFELVLLESERKSFREAVVVFSENFSDYFLVLVNFTDADRVSVEHLNKVEGQSYFYCTELGGKTCSGEERCSEAETDSLDGKCCLAQCEAEPETSYAWAGYLIAGVILIALILVFFKYRKTGQNTGGEIKKRFSLAEKNLP